MPETSETKGHRLHLARLRRYANACADRFLVGQAFGDWHLDTVLGQGRFATTYSARFVGLTGGLGLPKQAALKLIKLDRGLIDLGAVWGETAALSLCDHPAIPHWLGIVNARERGSRYFVIQTLMPGCSLSLLLRRDRVAFDADSIASTGLQLIDVLDHAYGKGVVHNDLRPANILLDERGHLSLIDFGLSEHFNREAASLSFAHITATDRGGLADVLLSLLYANPDISRRCATADRNRPWYDDLDISTPQRDFLLALFSDESLLCSYAELRDQFEAAFCTIPGLGQ